MPERQQKKGSAKTIGNFVPPAVLSVILAVASFGAMLVLGYSVLGIEFRDELIGWWGLSFLASYIILAAGLIVGVRRFAPPPPRTIGYTVFVIAMTFIAVFLVAYLALMITLMAFPPYCC